MWYFLILNIIWSTYNAIFIAAVIITPSFHCYISSLIPQQDCSYKVTCMTSFVFIFQHVSKVLLHEKSRKSVQPFYSFKEFTAHIKIGHNFIRYIFFKIKNWTTSIFHFILIFQEKIVVSRFTLFIADDSHIFKILTLFITTGYYNTLLK